jgi:hypothetical protein
MVAFSPILFDGDFGLFVIIFILFSFFRLGIFNIPVFKSSFLLLRPALLGRDRGLH